MDRLRFLTKVIGYSALVALFVWYFFSSLTKSYDLSVNGQVSIAEVVDYQYKESRGRKGRTNRHYNHKIKYNFHSTWIDLGEEYPINSKFYVTYSSENISNIALGDKKLTIFEYFKNDIGWLGFIICTLMILYCFYEVFINIKLFIAPPKVEKVKLSELQIEQTNREIKESKARLLKPIKKSSIAFGIVFILICVLGNGKDGVIQLLQSAFIISLIVFFLAFLAFYKSKKTV